MFLSTEWPHTHAPVGLIGGCLMFKPPECGWTRHPLSSQSTCQVKPQVRISYGHLTIRFMLPCPNISSLMHPVVISGEINRLTKPLLLSHIFKHEPAYTRCSVTQRDITLPVTEHCLLIGTANMNCWTTKVATQLKVCNFWKTKSS